MSQERQQSGAVTMHLPGIFQSLAAVFLGSIFTPAVSAFWNIYLKKDPPEWAKGAVPSIVGALAVLLIYVLAKVGHSIIRARAHTTATAKGDRISILVAELGEDEESESARDRVLASIKNELGRHVELIPAGARLELAPGFNDEEGAIKPAAEARKLLRKKHGDLLIWGKLQKFGSTQIELRFVSAAEGLDGTERKVFGLGEKFTLDANFGPDMGAALAAVVASRAAETVGDGGRYVVDVLRPLAARLSGLRHNLPISMTPDDRASFLLAYADISQTIGEQAGESDALMEAVAAYREALKEYTRDRVPLAWAMTQNNLGAALRTLGEREIGTERLLEAVAAYREALKELTAEQTPYYCPIVQRNLAGAESLLAERSAHS